MRKNEANNDRMARRPYPNEPERELTIGMTWPEIAELIFPTIQEEIPFWRGKTLDEFISDSVGFDMAFVAREE